MYCSTGHGAAIGTLMSNGSYSFSNPVFSSLAGYSSMALLKMFGLSGYTMFQRIRTSNFAAPEDEIYKKLLSRFGYSSNSVSETLSGNKISRVDRVRNNHLNDLENIVPFVLIGLFYVGTQPKFEHALWHFRMFLISRVFHTIAYQVGINDNENIYNI